MSRPTAALLAVLMLAGCESPLFQTPPPPIGPRLSAEQITAALSGNSLSTSEEVVPPLTIFFAEDGVMRGVRSNNYTDSGTWKVEDDAVCGAWQNWMGTMSRCWEVYRADKWLTLKRTDHGGVFRAKLETGNTARLK